MKHVDSWIYLWTQNVIVIVFCVCLHIIIVFSLVCSLPPLFFFSSSFLPLSTLYFFENILFNSSPSLYLYITSILSRLSGALLCFPLFARPCSAPWRTGNWWTVRSCWMWTTWWRCANRIGSVCIRTCRSSTGAWWQRAWLKPKTPPRVTSPNTKIWSHGEQRSKKPHSVRGGGCVCVSLCCAGTGVRVITGIWKISLIDWNINSYNRQI